MEKPMKQKTDQYRENEKSQKLVLWTTYKEMNLETNFTPSQKLTQNGKWTLYVKCKTIKLLENNTGENLDDFLDTTPRYNPFKKIS